MDERDRALPQTIAALAQEALDDLTGVGQRAYEKDRRLQLITGHLLIQMGESANRLGVQTQAAVPYDWTALRAFRNISVHQYEGLMHGQVYRTVTAKMPALIRTIDAHLSGGPDRPA